MASTTKSRKVKVQATMQNAFDPAYRGVVADALIKERGETSLKAHEPTESSLKSMQVLNAKLKQKRPEPTPSMDGRAGKYGARKRLPQTNPLDKLPGVHDD
jgi:hypothetical protein